VVDEVRIVEVRLVAGERDNAAVAVSRLVVVAFGLVEPAKTLVAVMRTGEAREHVVSGRLGRVEFLGVDEGEHGIGRVVQLLTAVVAEVRMLVRCGRSRIGGGELLAVSRFVLGEAAAFVFLAAAAGAEIIS